MSSDGVLYYMTGTPVELTQTNNNNSNEINFNHTIMSTNCESNYEYTTDEICSSNDNRNENKNSDHIQINSSVSQNFSTADIDSALLANNITSCAYIVNNNSTSKSDEGTVYFSSHYDGVSTNCQPVSGKSFSIHIMYVYLYLVLLERNFLKLVNDNTSKIFFFFGGFNNI